MNERLMFDETSREVVQEIAERYSAQRQRWAEESRKRKERGYNWYSKNKEKTKNRDLVKNHGITLEERDSMFAAQGYACAACRTTTNTTKYDWHTDHDHKTGKLRGILCHGCNCALGLLGDDPEKCNALAEYRRQF